MHLLEQTMTVFMHYSVSGAVLLQTINQAVCSVLEWVSQNIIWREKLQTYYTSWALID